MMPNLKYYWDLYHCKPCSTIIIVFFNYLQSSYYLFTVSRTNRAISPVTPQFAP